MKRTIYLWVSSFWLGFLSALATTIMYVYLSWPIMVEAFNFIAKELGSKAAFNVPQVASLPLISLAEMWTGFAILLNGRLPTIAQAQMPWIVLEAVITGSLMFTFLIWLIGSEVGLAFNLKTVKMSRLRRLGLQVQLLILSPFVGLIESFPALVGLLEFLVVPRKREDFHIISK